MLQLQFTIYLIFSQFYNKTFLHQLIKYLTLFDSYILLKQTLVGYEFF